MLTKQVVSVIIKTSKEAIKKACEMLKEDPYYFSEEDINEVGFTVFDYYTDFEEILLD